MHNPVIELQQISCTFGSQHVLRNVDLSIHSGETVAIIGESGCGKSVSLKIMMQLMTQTGGQLRWFGRDVSQLSPSDKQRERLRLGYLFQGAALFDSLSIGDNVAFGLRQNTSLNERQIRETVVARLADVGLAADVMRKRPSEISGGMQKRVGLARALAMNPDVMFYDEPTTGLDPVNSRRIDELIDSIRRSFGVTGIIVTHDLRTVQRVADRIIMLSPHQRLAADESQVIFQGTFSELAVSRDPRVQEYVGSELLAGHPATSDHSAPVGFAH
ncbi:MAG: ATP-binding cassette domain-containing protein [Planctomycetaceae bacterium]